MTDSILNSTKKILGVPATYTEFDLDILIHINSAFSTLEQIGVGPVGGFSIVDENDTWDAFLGVDPRLNSVKTYISLRVRMLFDPPATSFLMNAIQEQIREMEWRLNVLMEGMNWVSPAEADATVWVVSDTDPLPAEMTEGEIAIDPATGNVWRLT